MISERVRRRLEIAATKESESPDSSSDEISLADDDELSLAIDDEVLVADDDELDLSDDGLDLDADPRKNSPEA